MEQITAYRILGLEPGSSFEEIKEAYAALSKQYHPEENPEEFQRIHEAYQVLAKERRERRRNSRKEYYEQEVSKPEVVLEMPEVPDLETIPEIQEFSEPEAILEIQKAQEVQGYRKYDFEDAIKNAEEKETDVVLQKAVAEMEKLCTTYSERLNLFELFFRKPIYQPVLRRAEFIIELIEILKEIKLKKSIYLCISDYYQLREIDLQMASPEIKELHRLLDERCPFNKKADSKWKLAILLSTAAFVVFGISRQLDIIRVVVVAVWILLVELSAWRFYQRMNENYSSVVVQAILAVGILIFNFIIEGNEVYENIFNNIDAGNDVIMVSNWCARIWLVVLFIWEVRRRVNE